MKLRKLTDAGVAAWRQILDQTHDPDFDRCREELVEHPELTEELEGEVDFNAQHLTSRRSIAEHLHSVISNASVKDPELDVGLWTWLGLAAFEQLCPRRRDGIWNIGKWSRWVFQPRDYRTYYRHLLAGPYMIYRAHKDDPDRATAVLCGSIANPGEVVEQLASSQAFIASHGVMGAATDLYYDMEKAALKRGAAGKAPGAARRLAAFLNQLDLTWDIFTLTRSEILSLLPKEFDRYRIDKVIHREHSGPVEEA